MALEPEDIAYLQALFVPKDECNKTVARENEKINDLKVLVEKTNTKLSIMIAILAAIAGPLVALCVKLLFDNSI